MGGDRIVVGVKTARLPQETPMALLFILCLFGERLAFDLGNPVRSACQEAEAVFRDPEMQWMPVLCVGTYLAAFSVLRNRMLWDGMTSTRGVDLCRGSVFVISALVYFLDYREASQSTQAVMLLGGAAIGSVGCVNVFWRKDALPNKRSLSRLLTMMVFMMALACFWNSGIGANVSYKLNPRWVGPWDSPNLYGLLMSVGIVVAVGLAPCVVGRANAPWWRWTFSNQLRSALLVVAAAALCFGLWRSYSRGAWLAFSVGISYLLIHFWFLLSTFRFSRRITHHRPLFTGPYFITIALCSLLAVMFWQYQHTKGLTAHRAISISNRNDLSWRNRVAAWEGALQMMAERPWLGLGWNQPEPFYDYYYSASRLDETGAIQLNDYLMLGATLGIPTLFCFCMYLWLSLTFRPSEIPGQPSELPWLKTVCRAGALVLAVGFWFDGGLFKLPTAATFWILLEIGRAD